MLDNHFGKLGYYSLGLLYSMFALFSFVSLALVKRMGCRISLSLAAACYACFVASFILPALRTQKYEISRTTVMSANLLGASICGFGAAILWVAQGKYISECANDGNKGMFNSIFWSFYTLSNIIGNLCGAFVISAVDQA